MQKFYSTLILLLCCSSNVMLAQENKKVAITFDEKEFNIKQDTSGITSISSRNLVVYEKDLTSPGLPFVPINICVPANMTFSDVDFYCSSYVLRENVLPAKNPKQIKTNQVVHNRPSAQKPSYSLEFYPKNNVQYKGETVVGKYKMLSFWVCPFQYHSIERTLSFTRAIHLNISLQESQKKETALYCDTTTYAMLKDVVINHEDIIYDDISYEQTHRTANPIEYVIITRDSLKNAFKPLADWKKAKGVNGRIITIEEIYQSYNTETTNQNKIKRCLYDYYLQGLKYALLGGDDEIVPVQQCVGYQYEYNTIHDEYYEHIIDVPTDLYYGCFNGNFYWNENANELIGEVNDNTNLFPSIYVTRVPIRTNANVQAFVNKLLSYEKTPSSNGWNNNILTCGNMVFGESINAPNSSDAENFGDSIYINYIQPYWQGQRYKFYDTHTDFYGGADYDINETNLQYQLSQGYTFVEMISHGFTDGWEVEFHGHLGFSRYKTYPCDSAAVLTNPRPTIITTTACNTNQFNCHLPCLSESFIRNPNSNVIAYLGCSLEGWGSSDPSVFGPSFQYEAEYYKNLFSSEDNEKSFGRIVALAKIHMINPSTLPANERYVQFGLNPIGDPEMPIFISTPIEFTEIDVIPTATGITINTGVSGCTICVMSSSDNGGSYYEIIKNTDSHEFNNINTDVSVCITKQGYIPKIIDVKEIIYLQNKTIESDQTFYGKKIFVGSNVTATETNGPVYFNNGKTELKGNKVLLCPETHVSVGAELRISN